MSVCVETLVQPPSLMTTTDESLSCPQCPKSFTSTKLLQQHQQMFHTDKAFICETCGKAFRFRSNLAEHRSVHTAVKPYVCKFCGKSSRLKGNLTKHILKHHKKEQNESIAKDDIIVKKTQKPAQFKENGAPTTNGTTASTSTATATATTTTTAATVISNNGHNNNNTNGVTNHNLRSIKMEIEDPDYVNHSPVKGPMTSTIVAKVVASNPSVLRTRQTPKEPTVITTVTPAVVVASPESPEICYLPKDASTESDRSVLISLGFDYGSTLSLTSAQLRQVARDLKAELNASPESIHSDSDPDYMVDSPPFDEIPMGPTVGGEASLAALILAATAARGEGSPDSTETQQVISPQRELSPQSPTDDSVETCFSPSHTWPQCHECGKLFKKSSHLPVHMTMNHGYPPPSAAAAAAAADEEKTNEDVAPEVHLRNQSRTIADTLYELKLQQTNIPRVEKALTYIDERVGKLEKSLETALNSIYTLVQLQTGMTGSVNRLREDSLKNFNDLKNRIDQTLSPRRRRHELSIRSYSDCRDRSRSPQ